ncbi:MAG TPA: hypothetical protein VLC71_01030 [Thermomonas sp.]|nr:hypothetical protein [Thermomonas sp.]
MKIEIVPVWKDLSPDLSAELVAFWHGHNAIQNEAAAARRSEQAVCIARDADGAMCGVATAVVKVLPRLRQPMYYYRQFFAKGLRGQHQELAFFQRAKRILQDYNAGLDKAESLGILLEVENAKIAAAYRRAHEPGFDATFIGYSPRGLQLRVSYFDNAVLQAPSPLQAPATVASGARGTARPAPSIPRHGNGRS